MRHQDRCEGLPRWRDASVLARLLLPVACAAIAVLIGAGLVFRGDASTYFGERRAGTWSVVLMLWGSAAISRSLAHRYPGFPWTAIMLVFLFLGLDDLLCLHEKADRLLHWLADADPEHPWTDHLDDGIVTLYGAGALVAVDRGWCRIPPLSRATTIFLAFGFACFLVMIGCDFAELPNWIEDSFKLLCAAAILAALLRLCATPPYSRSFLRPHPAPYGAPARTVDRTAPTRAGSRDPGHLARA